MGKLAGYQEEDTLWAIQQKQKEQKNKQKKKKQKSVIWESILNKDAMKENYNISITSHASNSE